MLNRNQPIAWTNDESTNWGRDKMATIFQMTCSGFYTKGRPLVKSNLICPLDKLSWQLGCLDLNISIQGNFWISQGNGSSDNLPENLV